MWERGARHNPASFRYRFYMDHRPILPQDPTLGFWRKSHNQYRNIYYGFRINSKKVKYLFSNNIPVNDREDLKSLIDYDNKFRKNFKYVAFLGAIYSSGYIFNNVNFGNKYFYRLVTIAAAYTLFNLLIHKQYLNYFNDLTSYYYYKYQHLAVEDLSEVNDPRRKFFQLDKDSYYRESAHDIRHNAHHPANAGHHDHDTSTYYGPYPYDDHQNLDTVVEINRKFTEGVSKFDNPSDELILGEPIDIKRIVRSIPTSGDFRKLH